MKSPSKFPSQFNANALVKIKRAWNSFGQAWGDSLLIVKLDPVKTQGADPGGHGINVSQLGYHALTDLQWCLYDAKTGMFLFS